MTDIIDRLRRKSPYLDGSSAERLMTEAAIEIEQLRAALQAAKTEVDLRSTGAWNKLDNYWQTYGSFVITMADGHLFAMKK